MVLREIHASLHFVLLGCHVRQRQVFHSVTGSHLRAERCRKFVRFCEHTLQNRGECRAELVKLLRCYTLVEDELVASEAPQSGTSDTPMTATH